MKGNTILLSAEPNGRFVEAIVAATFSPLPGLCMEYDLTIAAVGGRFTVQPMYTASGATGDPREIMVLLEDRLQGFGVSTAYVAGTYCRLYVPLPGDEMNILASDSVGTSTFTIGERLVVQAVSAHNGKVTPQGTSANPAQFTCMETLQVLTDSTLVFCIRT